MDVPHCPAHLLMERGIYYMALCLFSSLQVFTKYGKCYMFNSGEEGRPLLTTVKGGTGNGLEIMLDIQQDEYLPIWGETGMSFFFCKYKCNFFILWGKIFPPQPSQSVSKPNSSSKEEATRLYRTELLFFSVSASGGRDQHFHSSGHKHWTWVSWHQRGVLSFGKPHQLS